MEEKLTAEKLTEYGFDSDNIKRLLTWPNIEMSYDNGKDFYFASNIDSIIYTGNEAYRKVYFKDKSNVTFPFQCFDLIPEYYQLKRDAFLIEQQKRYGTTFDKMDECRTFKENEITKTEEKIKQLSEGHKKNASFTTDAIYKFEGYFKWLKRLKVEDFFKQDDPDSVNGQNEIEACIENLLHPIKHECFYNDGDYKKVVGLLKHFLEDKEYVKPPKTIDLIYNCKTKLSKVLNKVYKQNATHKGSLKSNLKYFEVLRSLNHFASLTDDEIYNALNK